MFSFVPIVRYKICRDMYERRLKNLIKIYGDSRTPWAKTTWLRKIELLIINHEQRRKQNGKDYPHNLWSDDTC